LLAAEAIASDDPVLPPRLTSILTQRNERATMFKYTICDPLISNAIDKGTISKEGALQAFNGFPWEEMLAKMRTARPEDISFSPSIEFSNLDDGSSFTVSVVEDEKETVFYLFYKSAPDDSLEVELLDQTAEATIDALGEFVEGQHEQLRRRFGPVPQPAANSGKPWWKFWA